MFVEVDEIVPEVPLVSYIISVSSVWFSWPLADTARSHDISSMVPGCPSIAEQHTLKL